MVVHSKVSKSSAMAPAAKRLKASSLAACFSCIRPTKDEDHESPEEEMPLATKKAHPTVEKTKKAEKVTAIDFSLCGLSSFPEEETAAHSSTVQSLILVGNKISSLPKGNLQQFSKLKELDLSDNCISQLPEEISTLSRLSTLRLSGNSLESLPECLSKLKHLRILDASSNPLSSFPGCILGMHSLQELLLSDVGIENIPDSVGKMTKLSVLDLRENLLSSLPESLSGLKKLKVLILGQNDFSELPRVISKLLSLEELWVDNNRLPEVPPHLGSLSLLRQFDASCNQIDTVSGELGKCRFLEYLSLSTNDIVRLPEEIATLEKLVTLKIEDNQIEALPANAGELSNLEELDAGENYLSELPPLFAGQWRSLQVLLLNDNDLELLPEGIGECSALRMIDVRSNRLTRLPDSLDKLKDLRVVNATGNLIEEISEMVDNLKTLQAMWVSDAQRTSVPKWSESATRKKYKEGARKVTFSEAEEGKTEEEVSSDCSGSPNKRTPTPFQKELRALEKKAKGARTQQQLQPPPPQRRKDSRARRSSSSESRQMELEAMAAAAAASKVEEMPRVEENAKEGACEERVLPDSAVQAKVPELIQTDADVIFSEPEEPSAAKVESAAEAPAVNSAPPIKATPAAVTATAAETAAAMAAATPAATAAAAVKKAERGNGENEKDFAQAAISTGEYQDDDEELKQFEELERSLIFANSDAALCPAASVMAAAALEHDKTRKEEEEEALVLTTSRPGSLVEDQEVALVPMDDDDLEPEDVDQSLAAAIAENAQPTQDLAANNYMYTSEKADIKKPTASNIPTGPGARRVPRLSTGTKEHNNNSITSRIPTAKSPTLTSSHLNDNSIGNRRSITSPPLSGIPAPRKTSSDIPHSRQSCSPVVTSSSGEGASRMPKSSGGAATPSTRYGIKFLKNPLAELIFFG